MGRNQLVRKSRSGAISLSSSAFHSLDFCNFFFFFFFHLEMVGRLNLQPNACEGDPLDMSCRAERGLDSPDSGLPPSPSPSAWLLQPVCAYKPGGVSPVSEDEGRGSLVGNTNFDSGGH